MAAGLGFKTFVSGEVLTAADTNGYLMQGILVFASASARNAAITSPQEGQYCYLKDTNSTEYYDGAAWVSGVEGDISGVTAGTGISGGGTSGTVTVTNSMATAITTKGDLVPGTGSGTFSRLAAGSNYKVLSAQSAETTGLLWAGATTSFTPTWTATTAPAIGNGTMTMTHQRYGNMCFVRFFFKAGSTTTFGTGAWSFTLPFTAANTSLLQMVGTAYAEDAATAAYPLFIRIQSAGTTITLPQVAAALTSDAGAAFPFVWGNNDYLQGTFTYEVA